MWRFATPTPMVSATFACESDTDAPVNQSEEKSRADLHASRSARAVCDVDGEADDRCREPDAAAGAPLEVLIAEVLASIVYRRGIDKRADAQLADAERRRQRQPHLD